jgi:hypothetical protein
MQDTGDREIAERSLGIGRGSIQAGWMIQLATASNRVFFVMTQLFSL